MSEREIQRRFDCGELVFTDGCFVYLRGTHMGYRDKPWHYVDPSLPLFQEGDDTIYGLMEFIDCYWWTREHGPQLIKALASVGVTLTPNVIEMMEFSVERRLRR
jgi:hypothetical protein